MITSWKKTITEFHYRYGKSNGSVLSTNRLGEIGAKCSSPVILTMIGKYIMVSISEAFVGYMREQD